MFDITDEDSTIAGPDREASAKRRKVRKGTRSCWECKRRKIRCIFKSADDATCVGCQRRNAFCVSQEMPEELSLAKEGNRHLSERMARVEDVMKELLAGKHIDSTSQVGEGLLQDERTSKLGTLKTRACVSVPLSFQTPLTPAESAKASTPNSLLFVSDPEAIPAPASPDTIAVHHLLAALPAENDVKILLRESSRPSLFAKLVHTQPHSNLTPEKLAAPYPAVEPPTSSMHPVTLARRMLLFAITLQSPSGENFFGLSEPQSKLAHRMVTAATTWVTSKEEMHETVDGLVCIILEGVFRANCGDLRRAWAVYRRAMTVALMMGLHRSTIPPLKRIDSELDADPSFVWFRIVHMDRYLSLLLGLPQGTIDKGIASPSILRQESPLGQFERQLAVIASRILERNEEPFDAGEIVKSYSIDAELLSVSKKMPSSFWRPVNFQNLIPGSSENLLETLRLGAQVYYYSLLIQLHLPYMMHGTGDNTEQEYSKITCVNASREVITRFTAHRNFHPVTTCSRPVDFFALLAAMTLLLAHLNSHHRHGRSTNFLAHQRLSDRAMLQQALERMDVISSSSRDAISEKSAKLIRQLLDIEDDAAEGRSYTTKSLIGDEDKGEHGTGNTVNGLHLQIPYLGTLKIARQGLVSLEQLQENMFSQLHDSHHAEPLQREPISAASKNNSVPQSPIMYPTDQEHPASTNLFALDCPLSSFHSTATNDDYHNTQVNDTSNQDEMAIQPQIELPGIMATADDWAFQGVDMAFFDNLMRGSSCIDPASLSR